MFVNSLLSVLVFALFCQSSQSCRDPEVANLIRLNFYITANQVKVYDVNDFHEVLNHSSFLRDRNTVIYHYGFTQTPETQSVMEVVQAYLSFGNVNFILVNYDSVTTNTVPNACTIGKNLASAIIRFFNGGYDSSRLHLVGFSFGSTVFGITGREVNSQSNGLYMIERITGLDPGQIQNTFVNLTGRLNPGDAKFVETIHTEAIAFGDHEARGHVQYFVNGGRRQPMCTSVINTVAQTCSHLFASSIWVESIQARSPIFPALQCQSWEHFLRNECNLNEPVGNLGVLTSLSLRGSYFLRTNNESPFSRSSPGP